MDDSMVDGFDFIRAQALLSRSDSARARLAEFSKLADDFKLKSEKATDVSTEWDRAAALLRSFLTESGERLAAQVSELVTKALRDVFLDDSVEFKVTSRVLRGTASVEFSLLSDGVERPVLDYHGGGVAEVIAFVLRVVVVLMSSGKRPVLVLDEPFARVSVEYRPRLAQFVRGLADETGLQLIAVTHDEHLPEVADVHYRVTRGDGGSVFSLVDRDG